MENNNLTGTVFDSMGEVNSPQPQQKNEVVSNQQETKVNKISVKKEVANVIENKNISDALLNSFDKLITQNQLSFPKGYNIGNNIKAAYYEIASKGYLNTCTAESVGNAIAETIIQGLSPNQKHCYYIAYGGKVSMQASYFGTIFLCKRMGLIKDIEASVVREGEKFEIEKKKNDDGTTRDVVKNHEISFMTMDNPIIAAYCWSKDYNDDVRWTIMTMKQIQKNWNLSKDSSRNFQKNFPEEACKRTVYNRHAKMFLNTSLNLEAREDLVDVLNSINRTTEEEFKDRKTDFVYDEVDETSGVATPTMQVEDDF